MPIQLSVVAGLTFAAAIGVLVSACEHCTEEAATGIAVAVRDAETNELVCDARVTATDGAFGEALVSDRCGSYGGVTERSGTYVVAVEHDGYLPQTKQAVVRDGDCHVVPVMLTFSMKRVP